MLMLNKTSDILHFDLRPVLGLYPPDYWLCDYLPPNNYLTDPKAFDFAQRVDCSLLVYTTSRYEYTILL